MVKRQSNIELLRLVAMFLVLAFHANIWSLETCYTEQGLLNDFQGNFFRLLFINGEASFTSICVNLFVLISGYFGIKLKKEKLFSLIFQSFFISFVAFCICAIFKPVHLSLGVLWQLATSWLISSWFLQCYFLLMLVAPILNAYLDHVNDKQLLYTTCIAIVISSLLGGVNLGLYNFENGYSLDFFVVLYIIGRCIKRYQHLINGNNKICIILYLLFYVINLAFGMFKNYSEKEYIDTAYNNIFVLGMSITFFCLFANLNFYSSKINFLAKGCFAVYLFHTSIFVKSYFHQAIQRCYLGDSSTFLIKCLGIILFFYIFSLGLDMIRRYVYNKLKILV